MPAEGPRSNREMLNDVKVDYDTALYLHDNGMWTVYEIKKRAIAKVASEGEANLLIKKLKLASTGDVITS